MTMRTISFCNQKGGVSKTTTCANVATIFATMGYRVLAVDLDPQGNLTELFDIDTDDKATAYEVLRREDDIREAIVRTHNLDEQSQFDILPTDISLAGVELELQVTGKEYRLREALAEVRDDYDFCFIDCQPSLGLLVTMALTSSDYAVVPTTASRFAVKGIAHLSNTFQMVRTYTNRGLEIMGILFTRYDDRQINSQAWLQMGEQMASSLGCRLFETKVRSSVAVEYGQNENYPVIYYDKDSNPAKDYVKFAGEILKEVRKDG